MSPQEKGHLECRTREKKNYKDQKEFETEEKKQKRIFNHTKQQWGLIPEKENELALSMWVRDQHIKYQ